MLCNKNFLSPFLLPNKIGTIISGNMPQFQNMNFSKN